MEVEKALEKAVGNVRTEKQAEKVLDELELTAGALREKDIAEGTAQPAVPVTGAARAIQKTAAKVAQSGPEQEQALDAAVEKAMGASAEARPEDLPAETVRGRELLRKKLLKRLKPVDAADASIFIAINNLPHPKFMDRLMYGFTSCMTGGGGWLVVLAALALCRPRTVARAACRILPSMWIASTVVEYPIKKYFRRRRPFISIVRAIVVGKKPGNYSFPSGHTASAFAGATLLGIYFPKGKRFFRAVAALTGISRIYVGAHYPGDVMSGGFIGAGLARAIHAFFFGKK